MALCIVIVGFMCIPFEIRNGPTVFYYVHPTEPLSSCPGNSSCPSGQLCHTMDYLVEHSSEFFPPENLNLTLIFMCGVHNYTKDLTVKNLHSFVMEGASEPNENVIIDHQFGIQLGNPNCTTLQFFNVSFVNITNLTLKCPSINLQDGLITVKSSSILGYMGTKETLSFITISGRGSNALLETSTFKQNCFLTSNFSDGLTVSNSKFQSYKHQTNSIIVALSSVVTLTGNVNFTDSSIGYHSSIYTSGTAVYLGITHPEFTPSLEISANASIHFISLESNNMGGAVYGENGAAVHIDVQAMVIFMHNKAFTGGAMYLSNGAIIAETQSIVIFAYNSAYGTKGGGAMALTNATFNINVNASLRFSNNTAASYGGAIRLTSGQLNISTDANVNFSNNSAAFSGGAVFLHYSAIHIGTNAAIDFYSNRASIGGGAMYFKYATLYIHSNKSVKFIMNTAIIIGGAFFIEFESSVRSSIIVEDNAKLLFLNNSAFQGGALYIIPSSFSIKLGRQSSIQFINNSVFDVGGAVYCEMQSAEPCIFLVTDYSAEMVFSGNYANDGIGHHMYGTSIRADKCDKDHIEQINKQGKPYCWHIYEKALGHLNISIHPGQNEILSPVSSPPRRVCLCDSNGKPQCANFSHIFTHMHVYRGEPFTISACIVGYDFGTTIGVVHARFLYSNPFTQLGHSQHNQPINNGQTCTNLEYTMLTKHDTEVLVLQTSLVPKPIYVDKDGSLSWYKWTASSHIDEYFSPDGGCLRDFLLKTPVFINITVLSGCPPGLTLNQDRNKCSCYAVLANNGFHCSVYNKIGIMNWNSTVWVNATFSNGHRTGIIYNRYCSLQYCKQGNKAITTGDDSSEQCASNRTGILCGACMVGFSLAIGSSRCIQCPNSHNVALLLAFIAAGVFLVSFILVFNLTVTQGLINGLIFFANILWAYKILFPVESQGYILPHLMQIFVAWFNLDFGIETCFFAGLDAFWKTWLQFLFPFYIWAIAGAIIVACRYSFHLTNLIGSRAVPLLATLFLLSYMKLFHTIIDATFLALISQYPQNTSYAVWYLDGNLRYCHYPHIYLFIAAIATLVFLWLPYTLLLLFIQPLRRVSHLRPLKWINKFAPVYDAYFSPLKDKHHYWFGTMLLVRGILLIILTITSAANPELNVFVLFLSIAFLFLFISIKNVYHQMTVRVNESAILLNLIILSAGILYKWESPTTKMTLLEVSVGFAFAQFCGIVVWSSIKPCFSAGWRCRPQQNENIINEDTSDNSIITHERIEDPELEPLIAHVRNNN